jgi:hypothetical protein
MATNYTFSLSEDLFQRAQQAGLLDDYRLARLLEHEIERQAIRENLQSMLEKLRATTAHLDEETIQRMVDEEINAYRLEKKSL